VIKLASFDSIKHQYKVRRYAQLLYPSLQCEANVEVPLQVTLINPATSLRVTLIHGAASAKCTLKNLSISATLNLTQFTTSPTVNDFDSLTSVECDADCIISIYTVKESNIELGTIWGALYSERRSLGADELGRITLVSSRVMACLPVTGLEIKANDMLIDTETSEHYTVLTAQKGFDRRGRLHHWELDVVEAVER